MSDYVLNHLNPILDARWVVPTKLINKLLCRIEFLFFYFMRIKISKFEVVFSQKKIEKRKDSDHQTFFFRIEKIE